MAASSTAAKLAVPGMLSEDARLRSFDKRWPLSARVRNCNPKKVGPPAALGGGCFFFVFVFLTVTVGRAAGGGPGGP